MHQTAFFKAKTVVNYRFPRPKTRILHICRPNTKTQVCDYTKTKYRFKINVKLNQLSPTHPIPMVIVAQFTRTLFFTCAKINNYQLYAYCSPISYDSPNV